MHSRIFQVSANPISKEDYISEFKYDENRVNGIADYVVTVSEPLEDLKWLQSVNKGLEVNFEEKTVTITSKKEYFERSYEEFQEKLEELQQATIDDFITTKNHFQMYELQKSYDNKYGFYIDDNDEYMGLDTLDAWVREAEENKKYYIGRVFDYHF